MSLDLRSQLLKMLNDRIVDGASEVDMEISDAASLISDVKEDILSECQMS